jgi:hypothetical protein
VTIKLLTLINGSNTPQIVQNTKIWIRILVIEVLILCVLELFYLPVKMCYHVRLVPFHHGMASPQVGDGGDGLQIWRVAANILNKQSWTVNKGWSSSLRGWAWG